MKKCFFMGALALMVSFAAMAQNEAEKDSSWTKGGQFVFTLSQSNFTDWAAGGDDSYSGNTRLGLFANYAKGNTTWENNLDMAYGVSKQDDLGLRKTDDLLEFNSKFGLKAKDKWYYSALLNAKTQFDEGKNYITNDSSEVISRFMAPFYLNVAVGIDYKPNKYTSIFMSPVNSKSTFVTDEDLVTLYSIEEGKKYRGDFGAIVKFKYEREVVENINFMTKLDVFADYKDLEAFEDIDFNWEALLTMQVFKVISINLNTHLIWDKDVQFETGNVDTDGNPETEARIQFKEIFGAGLTYKF